MSHSPPGTGTTNIIVTIPLALTLYQTPFVMECSILTPCPYIFGADGPVDITGVPLVKRRPYTIGDVAY